MWGRAAGLQVTNLLNSLFHPPDGSLQQPFSAPNTNPVTLCSPFISRPLSKALRGASALLVACATYVNSEGVTVLPLFGTSGQPQ